MFVFGIPPDFIFFACTLLGVALFHHHTLKAAVTGLMLITLYQLLFANFAGTPGVTGLLLGFALLANHFAKSGIPAVLPNYLPDDWKGGFVMLILVFVISRFLENIAAAMIGGTIAAVLYQRKVHIGFLAAIVAASNADGSGSVVGDTTTMMWIDGVAPGQVFKAYPGAVVALGIFGVTAAHQLHAYQPIMKNAPQGSCIHWGYLCIVAIILLSAVGANVYFNLRAPAVLDSFPVMGVAVWLAYVVGFLCCWLWSAGTGSLKKPRAQQYLLLRLLCHPRQFKQISRCYKINSLYRPNLLA